MNISAVADFADLIAAIGILITLFYLARQVRHANTLARSATAERAMEQAQQEVYTGFIENPSIFKSLFKQEPLSELEWIQLTGFLLAAMRMREFEFFQMKNGSIDQETWKAYRTLITIHLGNPRTRHWWDEWAGVPFDPEFRVMVTELLDEQSMPNYFDGFQEILDARMPGPAMKADQSDN